MIAVAGVASGDVAVLQDGAAARAEAEAGAVTVTVAAPEGGTEPVQALHLEPNSPLFYALLAS